MAAKKTKKGEEEYEGLAFKKEKSLTEEIVSKEEVSIDDLHKDLEEKLKEQGFIFDRRKFIFQGEHLGFGDKMANAVAKFGGSWGFIGLFLVFLLAWMITNIVILVNRGFDPYPFFLLGFILACIASLQAPIIMMSQNKQAQQDRKQEEISLEKDIVDFKQDRLDLILDQKEWELLNDMHNRLQRIEDKLEYYDKKPKKKAAAKSKKRK